jgi:hypothetical protein
MRVLGYDPDGTPWEEMTATDDASYGGAAFPLRHAHAIGQVFLVSAPLPRNFRRHDHTETSYRTYALVRNTRSAGAGRLTGVMFLGRTPPKGFDKRPGGLYRLATDSRSTDDTGERRRHERLPLFLDVTLRRTAAQGGEERTVTENVAWEGAQVPTTLPIAAGESVIVSDLAGRVAAPAVVRDVHQGPDHVRRLHLRFEDATAFGRLLAALGTPTLPGGSRPS